MKTCDTDSSDNRILVVGQYLKNKKGEIVKILEIIQYPFQDEQQQAYFGYRCSDGWVYSKQSLVPISAY